ncbi:hypothetical protein AB0E55_08070 [Amycolatopsis keratiniphila]|uniref:hypothetical protein n=1 Tax=Amycolatopsis keratiniphila TaxID=129921 RepID=UPI0033EECE36
MPVRGPDVVRGVVFSGAGPAPTPSPDDKGALGFTTPGRRRPVPSSPARAWVCAAGDFTASGRFGEESSSLARDRFAAGPASVVSSRAAGFLRPSVPDGAVGCDDSPAGRDGEVTSGAPAVVTGRPGCTDVPDAAAAARSGPAATDDAPPCRDDEVTSGAPAVVTGRPGCTEVPDTAAAARSGAATDEGAPPAWDWVCGRFPTTTSGRGGPLSAGL